MQIIRAVMEKTDSIGTVINHWGAGSLASVGAFVLVFWSFVMVVGIIGRAFLGWSWLFLEEYTAFFFVTTGSFGLAYAAKVGTHVKATVAVVHLPKRARLVVECISMALCIWWAVMLTQKLGAWVSGALASGESTLMTETPLWIIYLILAIGCASLAPTALILMLHAVHVILQASHQERIGGKT